jgi:hypothetical protein
VGATISMRETKEGVPVRGAGRMGHGSDPFLGWIGCPGPFTPFFVSSVFLFLFFISFLTFYFVLQKSSNQFQKFSKNLSNI